MIGKGATPSFFAIAIDNYTLTNWRHLYLSCSMNNLNIMPSLQVPKAPFYNQDYTYPLQNNISFNFLSIIFIITILISKC